MEVKYYRWKDTEEPAIYVGEWGEWILLKSELEETSIQLKIDKGESYQICVKENSKITKIWGYEI